MKVSSSPPWRDRKTCSLIRGVEDIARLAASYAFELAKNHAFVDGNKRVAFIAAGLFLRLNGWKLNAQQAEATLVILSVASGAFGRGRAGQLDSWVHPKNLTVCANVASGATDMGLYDHYILPRLLNAAMGHQADPLSAQEGRAAR